MPLALAHLRLIGQEIARIAGNGRERRAQVMRDAPKKVRAELFIFHEKVRLLLLADALLIFQGERALAENRQTDAVRK